MKPLSPELMRQIQEVCRDNSTRCECDAPMARYTSAGVGGPVFGVISPGSSKQAAALVPSLRDLGVPLRALGNGTNLLVADEGAPCLVLRLSNLSEEARIEGTRVTAGAGMSLPFLVRRTVKAGLRGLEHAEGIPGTVGGATAGNAGCYGSDMGHVVRKIRLLRDHAPAELEVSRDSFGYRCSPVQPDDIVLEVEMELAEDDPAAIQADKARHRHKRLTTQPIGKRSAGCVFKNPEGHSAGKLIDEAGLKGTRVGGASVSDIHANFLLNTGEATTADFLTLIDKIQETVRARFDVELETEIQFWGPADGEVAA